MVLEEWLVAEQARLVEAAAWRDPAREAVGVARRAEGWVDFCSNDYLGLRAERVSRETLERLAEQRRGAGASRLIFGGAEPLLELERQLATWVGSPAALLFSSGYAANVGVLTALADADTLIISDALNHASIIDGARLSRARVIVTPHNDLDAVASALRTPASRKLVVVESYYSMDGDGPDLPALREICDAHNAALIVDDAHALGVYGPSGAGKVAASGVQADVLIGTLGKALATQGAFVAGSEALRAWLWNRARSFVFSTAPSPWTAMVTAESLDLVRRADERRTLVLSHAALLRQRLGSVFPRLGASAGPIVPIRFGDNAAALGAAAALEAERLLVQAIRPPTVPPGTARLRITLTATHSIEDLERLAATLLRCAPHVHDC